MSKEGNIANSFEHLVLQQIHYLDYFLSSIFVNHLQKALYSLLITR